MISNCILYCCNNNPADTIDVESFNVGLKLIQSSRLWTNIIPTLIQRRVSAGDVANRLHYIVSPTLNTHTSCSTPCVSQQHDIILSLMVWPLIMFAIGDGHVAMVIHISGYPAKRRRFPNVDLLSGHRLRRWPNNKSTFGKRLVFAW